MRSLVDADTLQIDTTYRCSICKQPIAHWYTADGLFSIWKHVVDDTRACENALLEPVEVTNAFVD